METVYGPIDSWRLKRSLGVDLISQEKRVCSFDCVYCQIEECKEITTERRRFVNLKRVRAELNDALNKIGDKVDYVTLSGMGEPTLASNLSEGIDMLHDITEKPKAILTNGSLFHLEEVRKPLNDLDYVISSLDAGDSKTFDRVNNPTPEINFKDILKGYKIFSKNYDGRFAIEIMITKENKESISAIASLIRDFDVDEIQLNTPLRPSIVEPVKAKELKEIESDFQDVETKIVYEEKRTKTANLDEEEIIRRGRPKK